VPSNRTLYVESYDDPTATTGYGVRDDTIFGPLGFEGKGAHWYELHGRNPLDFLASLVPQQVGGVGWTELDAGQYHPRFYKGAFNSWWDGLTAHLTSAETTEALKAEEQVSILDAELIEISRTVTPSVKNKDADGSKIRNALLLAATEVESQCKGILKANGYPDSGRMTTTDYVKVCAPMRLGEYSVRLHRHGDYPEIWPFKGWVPSTGVPGIGPTSSLPWYGAYNETKHDREQYFDRATFEHAIASVAAVHVLLFAQYGATFMRQLTRDSFFILAKYPTRHPKERSYPPMPGQPWTAHVFEF
jgi:hypothetical protein